MPDQPMGAGRGRAFRCESGCRRPEGQERPEGPSGRGTGAARGTGALKRSGSDMSLPRTLGELQLFCLLQRANLTAYYQNFIQQGGDDVRQLCEAGEEEFLEIMVLVGMASKPLHVRRLQKALREWMANPAAFHRPLASSLSRFKLSTASPHKPKRKALDGGSDAFPEGKRLRSLVPAPTGSVSPNSSSDGEGRGIPALGSEEEEEEEGELESRDVGRSGEAPGYLRLNRTLAKPVGVEGSAPVKKEELLEQGSERRDSEQPTQQVGS